MEPKSVVVKSKSCNSAIATRNEKRNKFSRSDVDFQPMNIKKRGVYVEIKENDMQANIFENKDDEIKRKPPPRPRPGQKRFLTSVLNILSKSTTGTQYPDNNDTITIKKYACKRRRNTNKQEYPTIPDLEINGDNKVKNKKSKYKSKILNSKEYKSKINDKFVILQSKKDIIHTPSIFSELSKSFTLSESKNPIRGLLENNIYSGVAEGIAKEILEGRVKDMPVRTQEDPSTVVADVPPKDDKKIYNFFVDLLETTFDIYNVKTDTIVKNDSEANLEIDETVATKLNIKNDDNKNKDHEHELNFDIKEDKPYVSLSEYIPDKTVKVKKIPKHKSIKAKSVIYSKPTVTARPSNVVIKGKSLSEAAKKKYILNTIKEELKMDFNKYEEPKNLYQALRKMAKYKRKCQEKKTIHFDTHRKSQNFDKECIFSQGIFPVKRFKKRSNNQEKPKAEPKVSEYRNRFKRAVRSNAVASNHSLEVCECETRDSSSHQVNKRYLSYMSDDSEVENDPHSFLGFSDSSLNIKQFYSLIHY